MFYSTVTYLSQLDQKRLLSEGRSYLIIASIGKLRDDLLMNIRYDRIKVGEERYDPFKLDNGNPRASVCNSYLGDLSFQENMNLLSDSHIIN